MNKDKVYPQVDDIPDKIYQDWLYIKTQDDYKKCYKPYRTLRNY